MFFITSPAEVIFSHRLQDKSRIRSNKTIVEINQLQKNSLSRFKNTFSEIDSELTAP